MSAMEDGCAQRRRGGRESKQAERAAALAEESGRSARAWRAAATGRSPRTASKRIHEAALEALETSGSASAIPIVRRDLHGAGAVLGEDGRLKFPRALVEDMLAVAARDITLCGRDPGARPPSAASASISAPPAPPCTSSTPISASTANRPSRTSTTPRASSMCWTTSISSSARWCRATCSTRPRWTSTRSMPASRARPSMSARSFTLRENVRARCSRCCTSWPAERRRGGSGRSSPIRTASSCRR